MKRVGNTKIVKAFFGAAVGIALSELAMAQLVEAKTPEERVRLMVEFIDSAQVGAVGIDRSGEPTLEATAIGACQGFEKEGFDRAGFDRAFEKDGGPFEKDTPA